MNKPSYRTEEGWARHIDRCISSIPDVVKNIEMVDRSLSLQNKELTNELYQIAALQKDESRTQEEIAYRFSELNGGIRELSNFSRSMCMIQSQHTDLLKSQVQANEEQVNLQRQISKNSYKQTEVLSEIKDISADIHRISRRQLDVLEKQLAVQEKQLEVQQYQAKLSNLQLKQMSLQTALQRTIANESQIQSRLLEIHRQTDLAKEKLRTLKDYFNSEIDRIEKDSSLPDVIKFLLIEKYIAFISNDSTLSSILSFLEIPYVFAFGSILNKLKAIRKPVFDKVNDKIDGVLLNLKHCALLDNIEQASLKLNSINILRKKLSDQLFVNTEDEKVLNLKAQNRVQNPKEYLGFFQRNTKGLFNKKARMLFKEFDAREIEYSLALDKYNNSLKNYEETSSQLKIEESILYGRGYPLNTDEFLHFKEYLTERQVNFLSEYPYFSEIRSAFQAFPELDIFTKK